MWAAASEMGWEHVWEGIKVIDWVRWKGCEPFESRAFEGGGKGFVEDCVLGGVHSNMSDVDFKVFVGVDFTSVAV